eukprot:6186587-Pleurochrysis_carterae.AAC.9
MKLATIALILSAQLVRGRVRMGIGCRTLQQSLMMTDHIEEIHHADCTALATAKSRLRVRNSKRYVRQTHSNSASQSCSGTCWRLIYRNDTEQPLQGRARSESVAKTDS